MAKKNRNQAALTYEFPERVTKFEYANTCFGKDEQQRIENADEYAKREKGCKPVRNPSEA